MKQYGMADKYIDVLVADSSLPIWRSDMLLDAVITDRKLLCLILLFLNLLRLILNICLNIIFIAPYGIRESTERTQASIIHRNGKVIVKKTLYALHQILEDLLRFSAMHLKMGGRLVTWIPVFRCLHVA